MNILVVGIDSMLGQALAVEHRARGDTVITTARNRAREADLYVELSHPGQWKRPPDIQFDVLYYCIGTGNVRVSRMETMQVNVFATLDYLKFILPSMKPAGQIVVLSSTSGSITLSDNVTGPVYAMSKAALNMGVKLMSLSSPQVRWTLVCPGRVNTRYRSYPEGQAVDPTTAAPMIIQAAAANVEKPLAFVNRHGQALPF